MGHSLCVPAICLAAHRQRQREVIFRYDRMRMQPQRRPEFHRGFLAATLPQQAITQIVVQVVTARCQRQGLPMSGFAGFPVLGVIPQQPQPGPGGSACRDVRTRVRGEHLCAFRCAPVVAQQFGQPGVGIIRIRRAFHGQASMFDGDFRETEFLISIGEFQAGVQVERIPVERGAKGTQFQIPSPASIALIT